MQTTKRLSIATWRKSPIGILCAIVFLFAIAGVISLSRSGAATFAVVAEAEAGEKTGNYGPGLTAGASSGQSVAFGASVTPPTPTPTPPVSSIRLGAAVEPNYLDDSKYANALITYKFDSLTPENAMKFGPLEGSRGQFNWAGADKIVAFAQAHNMRVRGHTLVWHVEVPGWVNGLSNADAAAALENHIKTVVGRYKGKVGQWDVVNEGLNDDGSLRDTVWRQKLGNDYIAKAFQWAHEADPSAQLFYNEFSAESRDLDGNGGTGRAAKSDAVLAMVKDFKSRGIPIDGVGLQTHSSGQYPGTRAALEENMRRLGAAGVKTEITELDAINIGDDASQATRYADVGMACKNSGSCTGVTTWGLGDATSWLGADKRPLMFDTNLAPKPAYTSLIRAIGR